MKLFLSILLVITTLSLSGCQGSNSDSAAGGQSGSGTTPPVVVDPTDETISIQLLESNTTVTQNSAKVNIQLLVRDAGGIPYSEGLIKFISPNGTRLDIGSFNKLESTIAIDGSAEFEYTAPNPLDANTSDLYFDFYHDSDTSSVQRYTVQISPDANQTVLKSYVIKSSSPTDVTMQPESVKELAFTLYDDKNAKVSSEDIVSMTVLLSATNPKVGTISNTFFQNQTTLSVPDNDMTINIDSGVSSGILTLEVVAVFNDENSIQQTKKLLLSIVVTSGYPSTMSLSYTGTSQRASDGKLIEKWAMTVRDSYGNKVNTNPTVSPSVFAGFIQDSSNTAANDGNYLYFKTAVGGSIDASTDTFTAGSAVFGNFDDTNDFLLTYGTDYKFNASGIWDATTTASASVLNLGEDYNSSNTANLGFAAVHNQRNSRCQDGEKWSADVTPENGNYIIDNNGTIILDIEYDYYMTGKSVMLSVNFLGLQNDTGETLRLGESRKIDLRGKGLTSASVSYNKGQTGTFRLFLSVTDTVEWYYNANFSYFPKVTGDDTVWSVIGTSMDNTITSCIDSGRAYVDIQITSSPTSGGEISLESLLVVDEF